MSEFQIRFALITECKPLELIRLNIKDVTAWAIVGKRENANLLIGVLTGENAPYVLNVFNDWGSIPEYENVVAVYGPDYVLTPNHAGPCDIMDGPLFSAKGSVVLAESESFLTLNFPGRKDAAYLNLETGSFSTGPGGGRAAFKQWTLWHLSIEDEPAALIHHP
jgi:hypothetical protein